MSDSIMREKIENFLDEYNLKHSSLGYMYLEESILACLKDNKYKYKTTVLYRILAKELETTETRIERCIRYALKNIKTTNSEFIALIVDKVNIQLKK